MHYFKFYPDEDFKIAEVVKCQLFAARIEILEKEDSNEGKILLDSPVLHSHQEEVMDQCYRRAISCFFRSGSNRIISEEEYMWDKYANHHKGFCVEYNENVLNGLNPLTEKTRVDKLYNVYYDVEYGPNIMYADRIDTAHDMINTIGHKLNIYERERETRLIFRFPPQDAEMKVFNKQKELVGEHIIISVNAVDSVYLGKYASLDTYLPIIQFCGKNNIPCYKLEQSITRIA